MNKSELVEALAYQLNTSKTTAIETLNTIFGTEGLLIETMKLGEDVKLSGFGTFSVKHKKARRARNPKTGETCDVPAKDVPHFKFSSKAKNLFL